jgi:hypothetical protein
VLGLYPEEIPLLVKRVEAEKKRGFWEGELSNLNLSSLLWAKPSKKRARLQQIRRELERTDG